MAVIQSCPALFVFCFLQIGVHLGLTLGIGSLFGFSRRDMLLASNANVGGKAFMHLFTAVYAGTSSLQLSYEVKFIGLQGVVFVLCKL